MANVLNLLLNLAIAGLFSYQAFAAPKTSERQTLHADALVEQIGVCVHLSFFNTPYNKFDELVRPWLKETGIRHIRDGAFTNIGGDHLFYRRLRALAKDGIKFSLIAYDETSPAYAADLSKLRSVFEWSGRGVVFFEGTNEPNLKKVQNWAKIVRERQKELFNAVRSDEVLSEKVSVLGATPWGPSAQELGDISAFVDNGNWHIYSGGQHPESFGPASLKDYKEQASRIYPNRPIAATEAGYHSGMQVPLLKHRPTPEPIVARYLPRLILWNLQHQIVRTYLYEFIDSFARGQTDAESNFGLIRATGEKKASFFAIKSLISLFADPGQPYTPQQLEYTILPQSTEVQSMPFQKRNGKYLLAVWIGLPAWNPVLRTNLDVPSRKIQIRIPEATQEVDVHSFSDDGTFSTASVRTKNGNLQLEVSDKITVLEF